MNHNQVLLLPGAFCSMSLERQCMIHNNKVSKPPLPAVVNQCYEKKSSWHLNNKSMHVDWFLHTLFG